MKPFLPALVLAMAAVSGCAAGAADAEPAPVSSHAAKAPAASGGCPTAVSLPMPKGFPAGLPVPAGAVVTSVEHRTGDRLVIATVVRDGFEATLAFLQQRLPRAGYTLEEGEVEADDAESDFTSATVEGRWTLRKMPDCESGVYLTYLTKPK
jgi:hypothetical protein